MTFYDPADDIEFAENVDGFCPVCGAEGNNCTGGEASMYDSVVTFVPPKPLNDPLATFIVPERIYEETVVGTRTVRKLLYPAGAKIRPEEAKRLGLLPS